MKISGRTLLLLILAIASSLNLTAQFNWELKNPQPSTETGKDIQFVSQNTGFIINGKQLLKTTDCGLSWQIALDIKSGNDICIKNSIGFIVGDADYVLKTVDNGETWVQIDPVKVNDKTINYHTVNIIDSNTIIFSGHNNDEFDDRDLIVTSTDGGVKWKARAMPYLVGKIYFINSLVGHALDDYGTIRKTTDGGATWKITSTVKVSPSIPNPILYFVNENLGFAAIDTKMFQTTDGGETWKEVGLPLYTHSYYFTNQSIGYAAINNGGSGQVLKTTDGGKTWMYTLNFPVRFPPLESIHFIDANIGFATSVGGFILKTTDGGTTWKSVPIHEDIKKIQFVSDNTGFVLSNFNLFRTDDGGNNWKKIIYLSTYDNFYFVNENIGYSFSAGKISKTTDGGNTWEIRGSIQANICSTIHFADESNGFLSTNVSGYRTTDGGVTWQKIENHYFKRYQFLNAQVGYATDGNLYKTIDGGANWKFILDDGSEFHFPDEKNGYAISYGTLYKTTDAGVTWTSTKLSVPDFDYMKFQDKNTGFFKIGKNIYKTSDGGKTMTTLLNHPSDIFVDVTKSSVFAGGQYGQILKYGISGNLDVEDLSYSDSKIKIYPNPSSSYVSVFSEWDLPIESTELYDIQGNIIDIKSNINIPNYITFDFTSKSAGVYILKLKLQDGKIETRKIIIQ